MSYEFTSDTLASKKLWTKYIRFETHAFRSSYDLTGTDKSPQKFCLVNIRGYAIKQKQNIIYTRAYDWRTRAFVFPIEGKKPYLQLKRHQELQKFLCEENGRLSACQDVDSVINVLDHTHVPSEWWLFIDASKSSLKAILLDNGNQYSICKSQTGFGKSTAWSALLAYL